MCIPTVLGYGIVAIVTFLQLIVLCCGSNTIGMSVYLQQKFLVLTLMQVKIKQQYLVIVDAPFYKHKRCCSREKGFACNFLEVPLDPVVPEGLLILVSL